jgi:hypothetical protein
MSVNTSGIVKYGNLVIKTRQCTRNVTLGRVRATVLRCIIQEIRVTYSECVSVLLLSSNMEG